MMLFMKQVLVKLGIPIVPFGNCEFFTVPAVIFEISFTVAVNEFGEYASYCVEIFFCVFSYSKIFLLRADIGIEYENKSFYTLFMHYRQGVTSFTKSPVSTHLNSLEIGLMIKASDLF